MQRTAKSLKKSILTLCLAAVTLTGSGCTLFGGLADVVWSYAVFWQTTPIIPVSAYWSGKIEDKYWEEERYDRAYVLDPVEGENAPLFCLDPPTPDEVIRALPEETAGGYAFIAETQRNNVRMTVEPIVDRIDDCKFYPLVGPARLHHCHYKCTVYYEKTIRSNWPIPFKHVDNTQEVVYIDHDHLIRCAGPETSN